MDDNIHRIHNDCWRLSQGVASEMPSRPCQRPNDRMSMSAMLPEHSSPALAPLSSLTTWFHDRCLYYILPNRIYYFLGANISDSRGEIEWYQLMDITNCPADRADLMWLCTSSQGSQRARSTPGSSRHELSTDSSRKEFVPLVSPLLASKHAFEIQ